MGEHDEPGVPAPGHMSRAPWERPIVDFHQPPPRDPAPAAAEEPSHRPSEETNSGKLSVADLLARLGQPGANRKAGTRRRNADPEEPATTDVESDNVAHETQAHADEPPAQAPEVDSATELIPAVDEVEWPILDDSPDTELLAASDPYPATETPSAEPTEIAAAPRARSHQTGRRAAAAGKVALCVISILALATTGGAWGWKHAKDGAFNRVSALDQNSSDIRNSDAQTGDENFLIAGTDTRAGANGQMNAGDTEAAGGARSDTVILVNIPADRSRVVAVSFPRDLAITPIECKSWDNGSGTYGTDTVTTETKLNSTYGFGGPACLVKEIQSLSGIHINHFVGMDFSGFAKLVDQVGGVQVCSTVPLTDYELGPVLTQAGSQVINGTTALQYVRARQVISEGNGDYGRIKRQQLFLSSLLRASLSNKVLLDPGKLNSFVNTFIHEAFVDNVGVDDLLNLGRSLQGISAGRVTFLTVPTDGTDSEGNETPRTQGIRDIFDAIINDQPLPGEQKSATPSAPTTTSEAVQPPTDLAAVSPSGVSVQVSNGTGVTGVATTTSNSLSNYGYTIETTDSYDQPITTTTIRFSPGQEVQAATLASSVPGAVLQRVNGMGTTVQLIIAPGYTGQITAPAALGTVLRPTITDPGTAPVTLPSDLTVTNAADTTCS